VGLLIGALLALLVGQGLGLLALAAPAEVLTPVALDFVTGDEIRTPVEGHHRDGPIHNGAADGYRTKAELLSGFVHREHVWWDGHSFLLASGGERGIPHALPCPGFRRRHPAARPSRSGGWTVPRPGHGPAAHSVPAAGGASPRIGWPWLGASSGGRSCRRG